MHQNDVTYVLVFQQTSMLYPRALGKVCKMGEPSDGGSGWSCPGGEATWLDEAYGVWKESDVVMKCNQRYLHT